MKGSGLVSDSGRIVEDRLKLERCIITKDFRDGQSLRFVFVL